MRSVKGSDPTPGNGEKNGEIGPGLGHDHVPTMINIMVSHGDNGCEVAVPFDASFGHLKSVVGQKMGLKPEILKLLFRGIEKADDENLQTAGVRNNFKVLLRIHDESSGQNIPEEVKETKASSIGGAAVAAVREEVDKLAEKVSALKVVVDSGTKVDEKDILYLTEMFMRQLLKLDGIEAEGEGKVQRKQEVRRVQSLVETMDILKSKNANVSSDVDTESISTPRTLEPDSGSSNIPAPAPPSTPQSAPSSTSPALPSSAPQSAPTSTPSVPPSTPQSAPTSNSPSVPSPAPVPSPLSSQAPPLEPSVVSHPNTSVAPPHSNLYPNPHSNPHVPHSNAHVDPHSNPHVNPHSNPYPHQHVPHSNPHVDPYSNSYSAPHPYSFSAPHSNLYSGPHSSPYPMAYSGHYAYPYTSFYQNYEDPHSSPYQGQYSALSQPLTYSAPYPEQYSSPSVANNPYPYPVPHSNSPYPPSAPHPPSYPAQHSDPYNVTSSNTTVTQNWEHFD
ncbi:BAG family molecular chaperone regulator 4-like [Dorcoceras hygrometricum]|uniref:BAG family molecular chaperone regulator 4-like n=1 Tax=Dorcoceras hygrometricum TaxID=472368 RepID=A0A2Z7DJ44_9LAMI|nr:BAG family molecular chaperone regulator 4-like [Dorcoceras hygrometricum]